VAPSLALPGKRGRESRPRFGLAPSMDRRDHPAKSIPATTPVGVLTK
jgi:hypothetical protein